jgi:hypothetical protein
MSFLMISIYDMSGKEIKENVRRIKLGSNDMMIHSVIYAQEWLCRNIFNEYLVDV